MRVFVAGATGVLGSRLVARLAAAGHAVSAMTHRRDKTGALERLGARAVVADGLDAAAVRAAVLAAEPDAVVHQMTALSYIDFVHFDRMFALTNRLRTAGLDNLLEAAQEAGTRRFIAQSFCGWSYERTGGAVKTEADPLDPDPPEQLRRTLDAIRYLERRVTEANGIDGIVLRYGAFYGPSTGVLVPEFLDQLRRRRMPLVGDAAGWWSFVHVEDAAEATALAVERGEPGIYNIVDDEPAQAARWVPGLAALLGAPRPFRVPAWLVRLLLGRHMVVLMTQIRAGSNAKAKREWGWQPRHPRWREGFAAVLEGRG